MNTQVALGDSAGVLAQLVVTGSHDDLARRGRSEFLQRERGGPAGLRGGGLHHTGMASSPSDHSSWVLRLG